MTVVSAYAPENTMEAFELAKKMGADGLELDVHFTADGKVAVCHDEKVDRTSNGQGKIPDYVKNCHDRGIRVHPWTANSEENIKFLLDAGVDAIITNYPDVAMDLRDGRK